METAKDGLPSPLLTFPELRNLDIHVEWLVEGLLPEKAVTLLYGRTSVGKTWLSLMLAEAVSMGNAIFGKPTKERPVVYVDLENPLANMKERADVLGMQSMNAQIWHSTMTPRPPKLDSPDWELYMTMLPPNALVIYDTCRSAHDGKENDSDIAALVMGRAKELRDRGFTVVILHHTPKANDRDIKASGAWADLADHTIQFYKVKGRGLGEDEAGEILPGSLLCVATGKKTRFTPVNPIYLTLTVSGLVVADDPDAENIEVIKGYLGGEGKYSNQTQIVKWLQMQTGKGDDGKYIHGRESILRLLGRGELSGWWKGSGRTGRGRLYELGE
jgi:hypothetical protein